MSDLDPDVRERLIRLAMPVMARWGVRSRHPEWSDAEAQQDAAKEALDALAPVIADIVREAEQRGAALGRRATLDPGAFVKRGPDHEGNPYGERLDQWQARAIRAALDGATDE